MPYQLTYRSDAKEGLSDQDIAEILRCSQKNNRECGISGRLAYRDGYFLQFLEGEENEVKNLYFTIEDDNRHNNVKLLHDGPSDGRIFSDWGSVHMGDSLVGLRPNGGDAQSDSPSFTFKVFLYNLERMLSRDGYFGYDIR